MFLRPDVRGAPPGVRLVARHQHRHDGRRNPGAERLHRGDPRANQRGMRWYALLPARVRLNGGRIDRQFGHDALGAARRQFFLVFLVPLLPADRLDQELHAVALLVLVVAHPVEHTEHGFRNTAGLADGQEFVEHARRFAHDGRAAAGEDPEPALPVRPELREKSEVVDRRRDVILRASLEGDLELARQRGRQPVPEEKSRERFRVRGDVEPLVLRDAGIGTRGDVAHRVAARLPRRQPGVGEAPHGRFGVVQLHEMKLNVLARGDVPESPRVFLADVGKREQLIACQDALRHFDAEHLGVGGLTLAVRAADETEGTPLIRRHLAALVLLECLDELLDVGLAGKRQPRPSVCTLIVWR